MSSEERPYIDSCSFCENGLLRFKRCCTCDKIVALCDECELMWEDIQGISLDANLSSDSSYPSCPACGDEKAIFTTASIEELDECDLSQYRSGESV